MARHLYLRLFPEFQQIDYVLWNFENKSGETDLFYFQISNEFEAQLKKINFFTDFKLPLENCPAPCWAVVSSDSDLAEWKTQLGQSNKKWMVIHWKSYEEAATVPERCLDQKILSEECIKPVAVNDVKKRLKDPSQRYFFLKKYLDRDFYLFVKALPEVN